MSDTAYSPFQFAGGHAALRWGASLLAILLLHVGLGYYIMHHRAKALESPPPPEAVLLELGAVAPVLGSQNVPGVMAPLPPSIPMPPLPPPLPAPDIQPPAPPVNAPKLTEEPLAPLPEATDEKPPEPKPTPKPKPAPAKPDKSSQKPAKKAPDKPQLAAGGGAMQQINPVRVWQNNVLNHIQPFMHWPPTAPSWVHHAKPVVAITIDRNGTVLAARLVMTSGYEIFDHSATRIFKRAVTLPPPPPELPGDPVTFEMTITFDQFPNEGTGADGQPPPAQ
jgi:periplasmic protein TonB